MFIFSDNRGKLAGVTRGADRLVPERRTRSHGMCRAKPGCGLAQFVDFVAASGAVGQVRGESGALLVGDRVEYVRASEGVQVVIIEGRHGTPRQSRSLIRPSRILVFTVPAGTPSSSATSA